MTYTKAQSNSQSSSEVSSGARRAYVLAGGASQRMGRDKLFVSVDGEQLLAHTLRVCRSVFDDVIIVAKSVAKFGDLDAPVILDYPRAPGPLGGIIAALSDCPDDSCFVVAADLADFDESTIQMLHENYSGEDYLGLRESGGIQPLCGIYSKTALPAFLAIAAERRPYHLWRIVARLNSRFLPVEKRLWRNINTPADTQARIGTIEATA